MAARRDAVFVGLDAARPGDFRRHLGGQQNAAVSRLGALAELDLDHLDLVQGRFGFEFFPVEFPVRRAAAEIARGDLPNGVAAARLVVGRQRTLAGVVGKAADLGAGAERLNPGGRHRAKRGARDVEQRHVVALGPGSDLDPEVLVLDMGRLHRVVQPVEILYIHVLHGAERARRHHTLGALINDGALISGIRYLV